MIYFNKITIYFDAYIILKSIEIGIKFTPEKSTTKIKKKWGTQYLLCSSKNARISYQSIDYSTTTTELNILSDIIL